MELKKSVFNNLHNNFIKLKIKINGGLKIFLNKGL